MYTWHFRKQSPIFVPLSIQSLDSPVHCTDGKLSDVKGFPWPQARIWIDFTPSARPLPLHQAPSVHLDCADRLFTASTTCISRNWVLQAFLNFTISFSWCADAHCELIIALEKDPVLRASKDRQHYCVWQISQRMTGYFFIVISAASEIHKRV